MTRERYNYFYPGYTSNRGYHGAVAMLFEQGSSRGLTLERPDGSVRTLADALEQQYVGAWTAVRTAATNRETLLREYHASQRSILAEAERGTRRYLITNEGDPLLIQELVDLLGRNAIEVGVLTEPVMLTGVRDRAGATVGRRTFPAGTYVVERAQPSGRVVSTLLEPETPLPPDFLEQARRFVDRDENPRFYDITAWSLPLLFDLGGYSTTDARALPMEPVVPREAGVGGGGAMSGAWNEARYAYVLDGNSAASLAVLYHLKAEGHRAAVLWRPTVIAGDSVAGGSVIVRVGQNDDTIHEAVERLAGRYGVGVRAVHTGRSATGGPALGSGDFSFNVELPRIAILAEDPVFGYSFGWAWYTLDVQYEVPVTVLRTRMVSSTDLSHYNVIVVPAVSGGALAGVLGDTGMDRLRAWIRDGGTLVTIGAATEFARDQLDVLSLRSWYDTDEGENAAHYRVPGAVFRAEVDRGYWMSAGYDDGDVPVLVDSDRLYLAPEGPVSSRRRVIARYGESALLSGHAWPETLERIPGVVFVFDERVGRGRVIAFAEDPNYRAYFRGANRLFLNAVILGPSGN
jgi:hypothetical protein